jgi:haloacetate dehalogenase
MKTKRINVSRGSFNVRYSGDEAGSAVVMLHGWPESSYCWEGVAEFLDPSLRIIAPDLRGLGDSERTLDVHAYQKSELAKDIAEIIHELRIDSFFLAGHDWGGIVAQELALLIPLQVKAMVIMNIPVIANLEGARKAKKAIFENGAVALWYQHFQQQPKLPEAMIKGNEEVWIRYFFGAAGKKGFISPEAIAEYIRCYRIEDTPATGASYYRTMHEDARRWKSLQGTTFPMPSLYIYGNKDPVVIPAYLNHVEDCFASIQIETLDAGHFVQEEKARETALLMNRFFLQHQEKIHS